MIYSYQFYTNFSPPNGLKFRPFGGEKLVHSYWDSSWKAKSRVFILQIFHLYPSYFLKYLWKRLSSQNTRFATMRCSISKQWIRQLWFIYLSMVISLRNFHGFTQKEINIGLDSQPFEHEEKWSRRPVGQMLCVKVNCWSRLFLQHDQIVKLQNPSTTGCINSPRSDSKNHWEKIRQNSL